MRFIQKLKKPLAICALSLVCMFGVGAALLPSPANAAPPSATSTLDSIMEVVVSSTVSLVIYFFQNYFVWIITIGLIVSLVGLFLAFARKSTGSRK